VKSDNDAPWSRPPGGTGKALCSGHGTLKVLRACTNPFGALAARRHGQDEREQRFVPPTLCATARRELTRALQHTLRDVREAELLALGSDISTERRRSRDQSVVRPVFVLAGESRIVKIL
jgi:hypothetical protein